MNKFVLLMSLCLLGSARGTSGHPDEPPGSMDHHASVQQLSGEYFSLANPSDAEALYETSSRGNTLSEHTSGEHDAGEHTSADHTADEQPSGEHAASEQPSGEHAAGEQPSGEHAAGEQPSGEHAAGEQASGEQAAAEQASGEHAAAQQSSGKLQFMVQGCENMCPSMNLFSHGTRMQIICCRNQPFCNKI
uniref:Acrosomal vesicle protein 1 n=1 Tax=Propithecus coquereli TaxID=379532 RepID=A0A2K6FUE5_PROCO